MILLNMISDISLESILKMYGLLCLICLPVSLAAMVLIYRKRPDLVEGFNRTVDNLIDGKRKPEVKEKGNSGKPDDEIQEKETETPEEDENESAGIPNLVLRVGDRYRCHLSEKNRDDVRGGDMTWGCDNPFVGTINEYKGVFEARRAGRTYVECGAQHIRIYFVDIRPNNTEWFGYNPVNDLLSKTDINNIKTRNINLKIDGLDPDGRTITYSTPEGKLSYEWGRRNEVTRVLMKISDTHEVRRSITEEISEYMEAVKRKDQDDGSYWIHKSSLDADYPDSVDSFAFMKKSSDGKLYFAMGETWREGASVSEIITNIDMMFRTFKKLLDGKDIPDKVGAKKDPKETSGPEATKKKKTPKKKPEKIDEATAEKPAAKPDLETDITEPSEDDFPDIQEDLMDGYDEDKDIDEDEYPEI